MVLNKLFKLLSILYLSDEEFEGLRIYPILLYCHAL